MCFSAEADLIAGLAITGIGLKTQSLVSNPAQRPIAALPVVFGVHQLIEAVVWLDLDNHATSELVGTVATKLYLLIALCVLPLLVPVAVAVLEPPKRRRWFVVFFGVGAVVAVIMFVALVRGPVTSEITGHHIFYTVRLRYRDVTIAGYVLATCGPLLASSHVRVVFFGTINLAAVAVLVWIDQTTFVSLWCLWAAVISGAIAAHLLLENERTPAVLAP